MKRRMAGGALMVALTAAAWAHTGGTGARDGEVVAGELGKELDRYMRRLEGLGHTGAAIVARGGEVLLRKGYGLADPESGRPVTPDTVFTVGSITKQFTGAAVLRLEEAGKLRLDAPITTWFAEVPADKRGITLHQLLTHTAGFPGAIGDDFTSPGRDAFLRMALETPLLFEPGARYEYSNVGFSLAAIVVEEVSGKSYEEFLRTELFLPAGMQHTGYRLPRYRPEEMAVGYREGERWGSFLERESFVSGPSWHLKGNGGIQSTVGDMLRWHEALEGESILSAEAKEKYYARHVDEGFGDSWYGYGWALMVTPRGTRLVTHNGGNMIFSADFRRYVDEGVVVFTTSARTEFIADLAASALAEIVFGGSPELPPAVVELAPEELETLAGTYALEAGTTLEVRPRAGHLVLEAESGASGALVRGEAPGDGASGEDAEGVSEYTLELALQWIDGEVEGFHEAMGGEVPLADLERDLGAFRERREQALGTIRSASVEATMETREAMRVILAVHHERASGYVAFDWRDGLLLGIEPLPRLPGRTVEVFPTGDGRFRSFDQRRPRVVRVRFGEKEGRGVLVFETPVGPVELRRE